MNGTSNDQADGFNNPFVKDRKRVQAFRHAFTTFSSTPECRVVWTNGRHASVPPVGKEVCDLLTFDTVAFVWMDPRELTIPLTETFITANGLSPTVSVGLLAKVRQDDWALRAVTVNFDEKLKVTRDICQAFLTSTLEGVNLESIDTTERQLSEMLKAHLLTEAEELELPFIFLRATVRVRARQLEEEILARTAGRLRAVTESESETLKHDRELVRVAQYVEMLRKKAEAFALERRELVAAATAEDTVTQIKIRGARAMEGLTTEQLIVAMDKKPEIVDLLADLKRHELDSNRQLADAAFERVVTLVRSIVTVTEPARGAGHVTIVDHR